MTLVVDDAEILLVRRRAYNIGDQQPTAPFPSRRAVQLRTWWRLAHNAGEFFLDEELGDCGIRLPGVREGLDFIVVKHYREEELLGGDLAMLSDGLENFLTAGLVVCSHNHASQKILTTGG
jgi:hypothetical protein